MNQVLPIPYARNGRKRHGVHHGEHGHADSHANGERQQTGRYVRRALTQLAKRDAQV
jgi:hypothetical protein